MSSYTHISKCPSVSNNHIYFFFFNLTFFLSFFLEFLIFSCLIACAVSQTNNLKYCSVMGIYTVANPRSCSKYFLCFNGQAIIQECAEGLDFDMASGVCTEPHMTKCTIELCPLATNSITTMVPNPDACDRWVVG